ncbi:hypothetical protein ABMA27_004450 [Loxostege sticticalis]|uniref:Cuticle protein n=1 Tax=Loxostege sticticalis TaxID=481309 RepID=A0ABR3HNM7_LOXSC
MFKLVVLSSVLALTAAAPSAIGLGLGWGGWGWGGHLAGPVAAAAPLVAHAAPAVAVAAGPAVALGAPLHGAYNYRGPLSLAPGQPASILAADGRPLDTLSVNADKVVHYTARAVNNGHGAHILGKRSAPLLAAPAVAWSHSARVDYPARLVAPAVPALAAHALAAPALAAPLGWRAGVAPWGVGPLGHAGLLGHAGALGHAGVWGLHG